MSPFEEVVERLSARIRVLPTGAQVALFVGASEALAESWLLWAATVNGPSDRALFDRGVSAATAFAEGGEPVARELLESVEAATPSAPSDVDGLTAAQDCWICLDTALRAAVGDFDAADSTWYLLEPLFQAVSERLFGVTDVGSGDQHEGESVALADPALKSGITALETGIAAVSSADATGPLLAGLSSVLAAIRP